MVFNIRILNAVFPIVRLCNRPYPGAVNNAGVFSAER